MPIAQAQQLPRVVHEGLQIGELSHAGVEV
jgi:hypothetical protein